MLILSLAVWLSVAEAAPPLSGTVVEGESVPGAELGYTRAQIEASYGSQSYRQGPTQGFCSYNVSGTGQVNVRYRAADGSPDANATPDDDAYNLRWSGFANWQTTAGSQPPTLSIIRTWSSLLTPMPRCSTTSSASTMSWTGTLGSKLSGRNFYAGTVHVAMNIFEGTGETPDPPQEETTATLIATASPTAIPTATPEPETDSLFVSDISMRARWRSHSHCAGA